jgi:hypothetical protein
VLVAQVIQPHHKAQAALIQADFLLLQLVEAVLEHTALLELVQI